MLLNAPHRKTRLMRKVKPISTAGKPKPPLPKECAFLKDFPALLDFVTDTQYDDGTPRKPGKFWFDNRGTAFEITLFEPDACARATVVANTIPDVFLAAELHLMSDDSPWQEDDWLKKRLEKYAKKK